MSSVPCVLRRVRVGIRCPPLVRYLLDAHPRLACPPETKFIAALDAFLRYPQTVEALAHIGVPPRDVLTALHRLTAGFLDGYAHRQNKPRWIDKTPNYYRLLPLIDAMFSGKVLYLFMVRHSFDCIRSLEEAKYFAVPVEQQQDPDVASAIRRYGAGREGWARYWLEVNTTLGGFAALNKPRTVFFRYEDLVKGPDDLLRQMCLFLGERCPPDLVRKAFQAKHVPGYQDWKIARTRSVHKRSVTRWKTWPADEVSRLWRIVGESAERFGYSSEPDAAVRSRKDFS